MRNKIVYTIYLFFTISPFISNILTKPNFAGYESAFGSIPPFYASYDAFLPGIIAGIILLFSTLTIKINAIFAFISSIFLTLDLWVSFEEHHTIYNIKELLFYFLLFFILQFAILGIKEITKRIKQNKGE